MNYIILNDKKSTEVKGLLISVLPPISKPAKRVKIEEIDGIDGDKITEVGYKSYDKEIQIGLSYDYDIDEVISYFNSEGVVTFSNEPDKYYIYKITEQIDFQRLLRFRTATVKFHVQPFKFSNEEIDRTFTIGDEKQFSIINKGNVFAKPILTIYGSGHINVRLNENQIFAIDMSNETYVTLDIEKMEAYKDSISVLKNRIVTGNYDNFKLLMGRNVISFDGIVEKVVIKKYSRWI